MSEAVTNVYDLIYPSPVTLKEISSIAIAVDLWRKVVEKCEDNPNAQVLLLNPLISVKSAIPEAPSVIYDIIEEYIARFKLSIIQWLKYHAYDLFFYQSFSMHDLLADFRDFVCDWNGTVHYVRTAKRLLLCDRLNDKEKFIIACKYCFEEDIERIWPSVSANFDPNDFCFDRFSYLHYWIYRLRNQLQRIPVQRNSSSGITEGIPNPNGELVEVIMLNKCRSKDWSSIEYFWNRIPLREQLQTIGSLSTFNLDSFVRFILPKLNELQLDEFLTEETGSDLIYSLLNHELNQIYFFPTWMYIRNKIDESNFNIVVEKIFYEETNNFIAKESLGLKDRAYVYREFWKNAPSNLKKSAIRNVLLNLYGDFFQRQKIRPLEPREMEFLITVLLDAGMEERYKFWHRNWRELIVDARTKDLLRIMKLCFENENEISQFMEITVAKYENISEYSAALFDLAHFKELNNFLVFCYSDCQKRNEFKQRLLQTIYIGENSILDYLRFFCSAKEVNEFIDEAFDSVELATNFKNQLMSSSVIEDGLFECIRMGYYARLMEFVDTFVLEEKAKAKLKKRLLDSLASNLIGRPVLQITTDHLQKILFWCLGSEDEVIKFKKSILIDETFCYKVRIAQSLKRDEFFLKYSCSPEEFEEFKELFFNE